MLPGSELAFIVEDVDVSIEGELALFRGSELDVLIEFEEELEGVVGGLVTFVDEFEDPLDTVVVVDALVFSHLSSSTHWPLLLRK